MLAHDALYRGAGERRLATEHLVQHTCEAVEVAPTVQAPAPRSLLGAHVGRRSHGKPGLRQAVAARGADGPSDPEVAHDRVACLKQDVLRLDIAVDHALRVRVRQCVGDLV